MCIFTSVHVNEFLFHYAKLIIKRIHKKYLMSITTNSVTVRDKENMLNVQSSTEEISV